MQSAWSFFLSKQSSQSNTIQYEVMITSRDHIISTKQRISEFVFFSKLEDTQVNLLFSVSDVLFGDLKKPDLAWWTRWITCHGEGTCRYDNHQSIKGRSKFFWGGSSYQPSRSTREGLQLPEQVVCRLFIRQMSQSPNSFSILFG